MRFKAKRNIVKGRALAMDLAKVTIGTLIMALGIELFLLPNQLSTGGFSGIATIGFYITGIPVGTLILILNAPLFLIAFFRVGKEFFIKAIAGTVLLSVFLNAFEHMKPATTDRFLAFIYGSIIIGIGTAIVLKANGSTGGTDLLANIIKSYKPHLKTGTLIVITDAIIVAANTLYFKDIEIALYSALAIYVLGKILDIFLEGVNFSKMLLIISPKWEEISQELNTELGRGTTSLYGEGMYTRKDKKVLLCVMARSEIRRSKKNSRSNRSFSIYYNYKCKGSLWKRI